MGGPPYQACLRLYAVAAERWAEVEAAYATIDLFSIGCRRFLNCVYAWCVARIPDENREEWDTQLIAPLPGQEAALPSEAQIEQEGMDFMAAMAAHQQLTGD